MNLSKKSYYGYLLYIKLVFLVFFSLSYRPFKNKI